jgi:hypothetical protein
MQKLLPFSHSAVMKIGNGGLFRFFFQQALKAADVTAVASYIFDDLNHLKCGGPDAIKRPLETGRGDS